MKNILWLIEVFIEMNETNCLNRYILYKHTSSDKRIMYIFRSKDKRIWNCFGKFIHQPLSIFLIFTRQCKMRWSICDTIIVFGFYLTSHVLR